MTRFIVPAVFLLATLPIAAVQAQTPAPPPGSTTVISVAAAGGVAGAGSEKDKRPPAEERLVETQHSLTVAGQKIPYTATAGTLNLKDEEGVVRAAFFYVSYVVTTNTGSAGKDAARARPVTFCFNGGPGSASLWVHLGAFGPRALVRGPEGRALPPPARLVDNDLSLLPTTDLVFLDPIWTGYSRPAPGEDVKKFTGLKNDIESVAEFIRLWTTRNERWASPRFLAGESYGTTRAAGLARYLDERFGMRLNGIILVSSILNWQGQEFHVGNDMPYLLILPTYTATAWHYKKLPPDLGGDLRKALDEAESFALHDYALALLEGDGLPAARRRDIATRLARLTGLSVDYVLRSNLRIELSRFTKELLRDEGQTIGRLDTRFTGSDLDAAGEYPEYDPASAAVGAPYAEAVNDYLRRELGWKSDLVYEFLSGKVRPWSFGQFENQYVNLAESLRQEMIQNPELRVLVVGGHYDLATPYFDSVYTLDHLGLPAALRGHIRMIQYEAGHMMYIQRSEHEKLHRDLTDFLRASSTGGSGGSGGSGGG